MSRYVSFGVLLAVILILGIVFYRVMASFILPLFLATVLVVVFGPVHKWVLEKTNNRRMVASAITSTIIGLAVILPVGGAGVIAFGEARHLFKSLTSGGFEQYLKKFRKSLNLEMPAPAEFRELEQKVRALDIRNVDDLKLAEIQLDQIDEAGDRLELNLKIPKANSGESFERPLIDPVEIDLWVVFRDRVRTTREQQLQLQKLRNQLNQDNGSASLSKGESKDKSGKLKEDKSSGESVPLREPDGDISEAEAELRTSMDLVVRDFDQFRLQTLGGSAYAYFKEMANPSKKEFKKYNESLVKWIRENFLSLGGRASQFLIGLIVNSIIMMIAVYFFLQDGSKMIAALKFFSPLDDRHEQELIDEFGKVCRAVMVATLVSAAAQGLLGGIGYYFAGVEAVFLLSLLTGFLAMVPFVGAASVWVPTCLYLYLVDDRLVAGLLLAIWGFAVVSTIDNLIKPYILHGQSNIHPLLALLSVLGGVSTLGPIGILVGPMVVVFLQTTLTVLHKEIKEIDQQVNGDQESSGDNPRQSIESVDESKKVVAESGPDKPKPKKPVVETKSDDKDKE